MPAGLLLLSVSCIVLKEAMHIPSWGGGGREGDVDGGGDTGTVTRRRIDGGDAVTRGGEGRGGGGAVGDCGGCGDDGVFRGVGGWWRRRCGGFHRFIGSREQNDSVIVAR